jgi:hypothetical protein
MGRKRKREIRAGSWNRKCYMFLRGKNEEVRGMTEQGIGGNIKCQKMHYCLSQGGGYKVKGGKSLTSLSKRQSGRCIF